MQKKSGWLRLIEYILDADREAPQKWELHMEEAGEST